MAKPSSPVDICNLALDHLKQRPINSIDTPVVDTEFIMARWYDTVRREALRSHPWKFAIRRMLLTPNPLTPPPFGFAYAYDLPVDYIRKISIGDDYLGDLRVTHVIEDGQILTPSGSSAAFPNVEGSDPPDGTTLYFRYVYDCINVNKFDSLFVAFFALRLAIKLAPKFSISAALGQDLKIQYDEVNTEARAVNGQDAPIKRIQQSKILTKRRGLPGGIFATKYTIFDS
jgi:hypothetical protein